MLLQNQILCKNGTSKDINVDSTTIIEENSYYIFEDMTIHWEKAIVMNSNIRLTGIWNWNKLQHRTAIFWCSKLCNLIKIFLVTDIYGC